MMALGITCAFLWALLFHYLGYRQGLNKGIDLSMKGIDKLLEGIDEIRKR